MFVNPFPIASKVNFGRGRESDILPTSKEHNSAVQVVVEEITVHI